MKTFQKVLCAVDLADPIPAIAECARALNGQPMVHVVYVLPASIAPWFTVDPAIAQEKVDPKLLEATEHVMDEYLRKNFSNMDVRGSVIAGDAALDLLRVANEESVDIIVMGTHGRQGLNRAIYGSVAAKVILRAPCPVLTVRPAEQ